eukprot:GFUD01067196.1.p1 GENE.GFUD01067196.1~~GFUD01067196.1.p1  ORF type:complete len:237 (+),score=58.47 GFUD01067196.1:71-781(+)
MTNQNETSRTESPMILNDIKLTLIIEVAGGTVSGKSTVCKKPMENLGQNEMNNLDQQVVSLSQDSFYRELNSAEICKAGKGMFNFDALDSQLMEVVIQDIIRGRPSKIPVYDFKTNTKVPGDFTIINPSDVVLVEGILIFYFTRIRELFDLKLFVDTDADIRLSRRVLRDREERGQDLEHILHQYTTMVKPAYQEFCLPTKRYADVIVPRGADNLVEMDLIKQHIQDIICRSKILH